MRPDFGSADQQLQALCYATTLYVPHHIVEHMAQLSWRLLCKRHVLQVRRVQGLFTDVLGGWKLAAVLGPEPSRLCRYVGA